MARRPGMRTMPFAQVEKVLERERKGCRDVYAGLHQLDVTIGDSLALPEKRYRVTLPGDAKPRAHLLTPNAMGQLCSLAGVPLPFMERVPASLGLRVLRCLLRTCEQSDGRRLLIRTRGSRVPRVRAVLPQSHVRLDDRDVMAEVKGAIGSEFVRLADLHVSEDTFHLRLIHGEALNLGTTQHGDPAFPGIDVITSETGRHRLMVRNVLFRVVCSNGVTEVTEAQRALTTRYTGLDRPALQQTLNAAIRESLKKAGEFAGVLAESRSSYVKDVQGELEHIFRKHRLGSPRGRIGQWVAEEVAKQITMFGVQRFEIVQAFTSVARGLDHHARMKVEDAMGAYLAEPAAA